MDCSTATFIAQWMVVILLCLIIVAALGFALFGVCRLVANLNDRR